MERKLIITGQITDKGIGVGMDIDGYTPVDVANVLIHILTRSYMQYFDEMYPPDAFMDVITIQMKDRVKMLREHKEGGKR